MSKISDAILETLLEQVNDYINIQLDEEQMTRLQDNCDSWKDEESIESEINRFLHGSGYVYDTERYEWRRD